MGTSGFFMTAGGNAQRLLLVTARHVVFTSKRRRRNRHFECIDDNRRYVMLFGGDSFHGYLEFIKAEITHKKALADTREQDFRALVGDGDPVADKERQEAQVKINKARKELGRLCKFYNDICTRWDTLESQVIGHIILSPPLASALGVMDIPRTGLLWRSMPPRSTPATSTGMPSTSVPTSQKKIFFG
jgi:hypothetical protein